MSLKPFLFLALLSIIVFASPQANIKGTVYNIETFSPEPGIIVQVYILLSNGNYTEIYQNINHTNSLSDANGQYSFSIVPAIPSNTFKVTATKLVNGSIDLIASENFSLSLENIDDVSAGPATSQKVIDLYLEPVLLEEVPESTIQAFQEEATSTPKPQESFSDRLVIYAIIGIITLIVGSYLMMKKKKTSSL